MNRRSFFTCLLGLPAAAVATPQAAPQALPLNLNLNGTGRYIRAEVMQLLAEINAARSDEGKPSL